MTVKINFILFFYIYTCLSKGLFSLLHHQIVWQSYNNLLNRITQTQMQLLSNKLKLIFDDLASLDLENNI
jgi:hypothetical protein